MGPKNSKGVPIRVGTVGKQNSPTVGEVASDTVQEIASNLPGMVIQFVVPAVTAAVVLYCGWGSVKIIASAAMSPWGQTAVKFLVSQSVGVKVVKYIDNMMGENQEGGIMQSHAHHQQGNIHQTNAKLAKEHGDFFSIKTLETIATPSNAIGLATGMATFFAIKPVVKFIAATVVSNVIPSVVLGTILAGCAGAYTYSHSDDVDPVGVIGADESQTQI